MNNEWVVYEGNEGPGKGKHIVLVSGDEEYRSEEALPMLGKVLATHHGFKCTVLFAINPETGEIDPEVQTNIPGLHHLESADMMVLFTRFRELPDEQMKYVVDYTNAGKPVMGLRTATHAFSYSRDIESPYAKYSFNDKDFEGGYGRQVLVRRGSTTMDITAKRARAVLLTRRWRIILSSKALRMSGDRPMFTALMI